ncbi:MAG: hypothetical protein R3Y29_02570 [bacterium]
MKIKKYKGETEQEVIQRAKQELGDDAIVLSVKKITPKGLLSSIRKPYIELKVSYDETGEETEKDALLVGEKLPEKLEDKSLSENNSEHLEKNRELELNKLEIEHQLSQKDFIIHQLERKLANLEQDLNQNKHLAHASEQVNQLEQQQLQQLQNLQQLQQLQQLQELQLAQQSMNASNSPFKNKLVQFINELLLKQDILPNICYAILKDIDDSENKNIELIVEMVYNNIMNILEESEYDNIFDINTTNAQEKDAQNIVFLGTTGVGKTTTIAKISSNLIMNEGKKVGFITADTYRIAAVEQLKIYAEILGSNVETVYSPEDIEQKVEALKITNDYIFFDTAGRSHKNLAHMQEIQNLVGAIDNPEVFLVVSAASRYEDIIDIIKTYEEFIDFNLIFTKIDETNIVGTILNISCATSKKIAYLTTGQNVPNDIEKYSPKKISKVLLGSMYK